MYIQDARQVEMVDTRCTEKNEAQKKHFQESNLRSEAQKCQLGGATCHATGAPIPS